MSCRSENGVGCKITDCFSVPDISVERIETIDSSAQNRSSNINPVLGADFESLIISRNGVQRSSFAPRSSSVIISTNSSSGSDVLKPSFNPSDSVIVPRITETATLAANSKEEISVVLEKVGSRSSDHLMDQNQVLRRYIHSDQSCGLSVNQRPEQYKNLEGFGIPRDQLINSSRMIDSTFSRTGEQRTIDSTLSRTREQRTIDSTFSRTREQRTISNYSGPSRFDKPRDYGSSYVSGRGVGQYYRTMDPSYRSRMDQGTSSRSTPEQLDNPWGLPPYWAKQEADLRRGIQGGISSESILFINQ